MSSRQRSQHVHLDTAPLPDGERMLTCLGPIGATCTLRAASIRQPKPPRSLERRTQRRPASVSAAHRGQPGRSCPFPGPASYRAPHPAVFTSRLGACIVAVARAAPAPPLSATYRARASITTTAESPLVPHHSTRESSHCYPFHRPPLHRPAAHIKFVSRPSEALCTPPPRAAYPPTSRLGSLLAAR
jgi:hypothetical protein